MASKKSPLSGYNHNMKFKGRVYHVQTEDSGLDNPHIFTHLFYDGTILSTKKQDYADLVSEAEWEEKLRDRMQALHKEMMKELLKGVHNERIVQYLGTLEVEVEEELPATTLFAPGRSTRKPKPSKGEEPAAGPANAPISVPGGQEGVVVAMPMVIIADGQTMSAQPAAPVEYKPHESKAIPDSIFGSDLISEKSLDEVILAYLSEDMADD